MKQPDTQREGPAQDWTRTPQRNNREGGGRHKRGGRATAPQNRKNSKRQDNPQTQKKRGDTPQHKKKHTKAGRRQPQKTQAKHPQTKKDQQEPQQKEKPGQQQPHREQGKHGQKPTETGARRGEGPRQSEQKRPHKGNSKWEQVTISGAKDKVAPGAEATKRKTPMGGAKTS
jgi:hypothetical protein